MPTYTPQSEDTRLYEICVLYPYPFAQKEEAQLLKEIEEIFTEAGAQQVAKDNWGRRGLAYKIGGYTEGNYVIYHYDMDPSKLKEVDRALSILKGVLRHMVVKPPKHYQITTFSEMYSKWKETETAAEEQRKKAKEDQLQKKMVEKAKASAKRSESERKKPVEKTSSTDVTQEIDKLISSDNID